MQGKQEKELSKKLVKMHKGINEKIIFYTKFSQKLEFVKKSSIIFI